MLKTTTTTRYSEYTTEELDILRDEVAQLCHRIPPLWDLTDYVAVNPFLGFAGQPVAEAAQVITDGLNARVLPELDFYRTRWKEGAFGKAELERVAHRAGQEPEALEAILKGDAPMPLRPASEIFTFAERYDREYKTNWNDKIVRHVTLWCAVHVYEGAAPWGQTESSQPLYASWREAAQVDRSLEIAGLKGWRKWVKNLPDQPEMAIAAMLEQLEVPAAQREAYLYRLFNGVFGWASYLRREAWQAGDTDGGQMAELLAIRICTDAAVAQLARRPAHPPVHSVAHTAIEDETVRMLFQEALEDGYARRLLGAIAPPPAPAARERPAVQAVFCIDVRSEPLRRNLEAQSPAIETLGFAGFFGITLDWQVNGQSSARCPVLLKPGVTLSPLEPKKGEAKKALKQVQTSPTAMFTYVETIGLAYSLGLAGDALRWFRNSRLDERTASFTLDGNGKGGGIDLDTRVTMAVTILKNMGLRDSFGRIILLSGHEACSENNSHLAGLDCGACCGHSGAINARVAAAVMNDPAVRERLPEQGYQVPEDTHFLPGVHDTSLDEVVLLDTDKVPASHRDDIVQLKRWLADAAILTRAERAETLGLEGRPKSILDEFMRRRAYDWAEVRPEWALARNAAFIAARRERTRGVDLDGRSFLHEYDWRTDPDNSILTLILSAPMVVASWINLQYFASTVDNEVFGCGTKTLHNRVGSLGVVLGNGGDLRTGLSIQSVHDSDGNWFHEPLRLQVVVEAPHERIDAVLNAAPDVNDLVENGWVRLFALDPDSNNVVRRVPGQGWQKA
jgi:hypothetical protein